LHFIFNAAVLFTNSLGLIYSVVQSESVRGLNWDFIT